MATIITRPELNALRTTFTAAFWNVFNNTEKWYDKLTTEIPSESGSNTYGWIMDQFAMREWIGPRVAQNMQEHAQVIKNKLWEETAKVKRTDVEDDNLGVFSKFTMPSLARAAAKHPDTRLAQVIRATGAAGNSFDGVAYFANNHPTFNNTGSGATTYSNLATAGLDSDGVTAVRSQMAAYIGENGLPLGVVGNTLIVPPQLETQADVIAKSESFAVPTFVGGIGPTNSATVFNPLKGKFNVIVVPEFADAPTVWYMADCSKPVMPFVFQPRIPLELTALFSPEDPNVFTLDQYVWGGRARYELGFALPYLCVKSTA